ncbi:hypothetical protein R1flu_019727 [Riccia fluitans]|uniref:Glycosyltransferase family 92 protein n=1 Tax=Riccia fluitans TaxID=41844 RepID=A0ABD1ZJH6_9MARC
MEIVERRKSSLRDKESLLSESSDEVLPPSTVSVWRSWTACLVLACVCTVFTVIWGPWLDGPNAEAKMTVNFHQLTDMPAISSEEEDPSLRISLPEINRRSVYVQDAIVFPDNVMLLVTVPDSIDLRGNMESLECRFGGMKNQSSTPVISIKPRTKGLLMVRCSVPNWVKEFPGKSHKNVTLGIRNSDIGVQSAAVYNPTRLPSWDYVVYESLVDTDSIILLVKGLVTRSSKRIDVKSVRCIFGEKLTSKHLYETRVITAVQEVVKCEKPPSHLEEKLRGYHMSIVASWLGVIPSMVYYNPDNNADYFMDSFAITSSFKAKAPEDSSSSEDESSSSSTNSLIITNLKDESSSSDSEPFDLTSLTSLAAPPKRKLCACTMVWNKAQFIKEWVLYHSFFGVERYFLYDNDSDDNIEEVVESLASHNISRMIWPWIKTQQAAFSHCTILAREECEWVMFVDVDEYIYPMYYLAPTSGNWTSNSDARVLHRVIDRESEKAALNGGNLGSIQFDCHNFGPSGLDHSPEQGVTVGYTCRLRMPERHKSIVRLAAVNDSLLNVLHHFELRDGYQIIRLLRNVGVVNHYKFQAWDVFRMKFVRRAGTYTTDWQKAQNAGSKDRTPGLGTEAVKPDDWEKRFCELEDRRLRDFVLRTFKKPDQPDKLQWEEDQ